MSEREDHIFDQSFRDAFDRSGEEQPSSAVWDNLQSSLAQERARVKSSFIWPLRWAATISILLTLIFPLFLDKEILIAEVEQAREEKMRHQRAKISRVLLEALHQPSGNLATNKVRSQVDKAALADQNILPKTVKKVSLVHNQTTASEEGDEKEELLGKERVPLNKLSAIQTNKLKGFSIASKFSTLRQAATRIEEDDSSIFENIDEANYSLESKFYLGMAFIPQLSENNHNTFFQNAYSKSGLEGTNYIANQSDILQASISNSLAFQGIFGMKLGKHLELETGVYFSKLKGSILSTYNVEQQLTTVDVVQFPVPSRNGAGFSMVTSTEESTVSNYNLDTLSTVYSVKTIEIPLLLRFVGESGRLTYFVSSGVSTLVHSQATVNSRSYIYNDIDYSETYTTNQSPDLNLMVGAGLGYQLGKSFQVRIEPQFRRGVFTSKYSIQNTNRQSFGLSTGMLYQF